MSDRKTEANPAMTTALAKYQGGDFNLLVPTTSFQQVGPWHRLAINEVKISPDPMDRDICKVGSRYNDKAKKTEDLFYLQKPAVMRIAEAAGVVWNWSACGPTSCTRDYVLYKAVGAVRLPDGTWQPVVGMKEIDLTVIEEDLQNQYRKKALHSISKDASSGYKTTSRDTGEKWPDGNPKKEFLLLDEEKPRWIADQVRAGLNEWRKNKLMRAESGAMLRVVRAAVALKSTYTAEELRKPFIVPRIDFAPDYNDKEVRSALIQHGTQAMTQLFGQSVGSHPMLTAGAPVVCDRDDEYDAPYTIEPFQPQEPPATTQAPPQAPPTTTQGAETKAEGGGNGKKLTIPCEAEGCQNMMSEQVAEYSLKHYQKRFCYDCQQPLKAAKAAA